jgi:hypothetical protein
LENLLRNIGRVWKMTDDYTPRRAAVREAIETVKNKRRPVYK